MQLINTVSHSALKIGHGLRSCTSEVHFSDPFMVNGRKVVLFDTPGFDDTNRSDTEILTEIAVFLAEL
jgi:predicted GTPase